MKKSLYGLLLLLIGGAALSPGHSSALTRSEIEKNLICYACPGEPLNIDRCGFGNQLGACNRVGLHDFTLFAGKAMSLIDQFLR